MDDIVLPHYENEKSKKIEIKSMLNAGDFNFLAKDSLWFNHIDLETESQPNFMHFKYKADYFYSIGSYDEAKSIYKKIKESEVPDLIVRCCNIDIINCLIHLHEFIDAKRLIFELMRSSTNHDQVIEGLILLRNLYFQSDDIPSGIITLKKLLLLVGDVTENWIFLANSYYASYKLKLKRDHNEICTHENHIPIKNVNISSISQPDIVDNEVLCGRNEQFNLSYDWSDKNESINNGANLLDVINNEIIMIKCIKEGINMEKIEIMPDTILQEVYTNNCKAQFCAFIDDKATTNEAVNDTLVNANRNFNIEYGDSIKFNCHSNGKDFCNRRFCAPIDDKSATNDAIIYDNLEYKNCDNLVLVSFEKLKINSDTSLETSLDVHFDTLSETFLDEIKSWICYVISFYLLNKNSKINSSFINEINIKQIEKVKEKLKCFYNYSPFQHLLLEDVYTNKNMIKGSDPIHKIILASKDDEIEALFDRKYFSFMKRILKTK